MEFSECARLAWKNTKQLRDNLLDDEWDLYCERCGRRIGFDDFEADMLICQHCTDERNERAMNEREDHI